MPFRFVISCFFLNTLFVFSQEPRDTTLRLLLTAAPESLFTRPLAVFPFSIALALQDPQPTMPLSSTLAGVPQSFAWERQHTIDLTAPLKLQMQESGKERPWKITLGAAQAAGTAYILYRHLKKYGFY